MALRTFTACFYPHATRGKIHCRRVKAKNKTDAARIILRRQYRHVYVKIGGAIFYLGNDGKPRRSNVKSL